MEDRMAAVHVTPSSNLGHSCPTPGPASTPPHPTCFTSWATGLWLLETVALVTTVVFRQRLHLMGQVRDSR